MTRVALGLAALSLIAGCTDSKSTADSGAPPCTNTVTPYPAQDATGGYYRGTIEATVKTKEDSATLTVKDAAGNAVDGTTDWRGNTLVFTPATGLAATTTFSADATYSCGDAAWSFTTSDVGSALDATSLAGDTYQLDLASGRFVKPEGVGSLLQQYLTTSVLMGVQSSSASKIQMIGAVGDSTDPTIQDPCAHTIAFPEADFTQNPYFKAGPQTTTLSVKGYDITIANLLISGAFAPDASSIQGAVLAGSIDTRPLVPLLDPNGADTAICDLAASIGVTCEACEDGSGTFCLSLYVDSITATKVDSTITEINDPCSLEACSADPACAPADTGTGT